MTKLVAWMDRHWCLLTVIAWLAMGAWFLFERWVNIQGFALGDTDDNLRMAQVRALLAGQDWFDLRQYRLNPPLGADIHWSRLVDLPLAGLILLLRPLLGGAEAERWAAALAPLIPLLPLLLAMALAVRRLVDPRAYLLAFVGVFYAGSTSGMFMPLRIDHHGWQLALLAMAIAGIADPRRARGGATLGLVTAVSLWIGLELLIYLAIAGVAMVLFWVRDGEEKRRLAAYGASLSGAVGVGFLLFASRANREAVCDALSPVWLSDALLGGALLIALAWLSPADWKRRLMLSAAAGAVLALFHAGLWPHCLSRLEGVSPEVHELWLKNVREARPIYAHPWRIALLISALPLTGVLGWALLGWRTRGEPGRMRRAIAAGAPGVAAALLLLWQTRAAPAAQMMGILGSVALVWLLVPLAWRVKQWPLRIAAAALVSLLGLGVAVPMVMDQVPPKPQSARDLAIGKANRACNSLAGMSGVARQPRGMVFTFVDYGPRLITLTHHDAVTGPYHRNGEQIADVMKTFRGDAANARRTLAKYRADYLLICPNSSTTTLFMSRAPNGFYAQLDRGQVPGWLEPVALPKDSPFKMWRVLAEDREALP